LLSAVVMFFLRWVIKPSTAAVSTAEALVH
jgi:hypothetical protein